MPNQRAVAKAAGVSQTAVSFAFNGSDMISAGTRDHIRRIAEEMGYRPNPQIASLMAHVRAGKPVRDLGCIAVIVDALNEADWFARGQTYREQYEGMRGAASKLGYRLECFFLRGKQNSAAKIDRVLYLRGITGLILAAPRQEYAEPLELSWSRYATAKSGVSWRYPEIDAVSSHHAGNVQIAFRQVADRGFRRIGLSLPPSAANSGWLAAYLLEQWLLPKKRQLPVFIGKSTREQFPKFQAWYERWRPDALLCLLGHELPWLHALSLTPQTLPLICLNRLSGCPFPGVEENHSLVGSAVLGIVASNLLRYEMGIPEQHKQLLINGRWVEGSPPLPDRAAAPVRA